MKNKKDNNTQIQYMPIGMCIGIGIGMVIGAATDNIPLYMCIGLSIGMCIGTLIDANNRKTSEDNSEEKDDEENE